MYKLINKLRGDIWYNPIFYGRSIVCNGKDKIVRVYDLDTLILKKELKAENISFITGFENILFTDDQKDCFIYNLNDFDQAPKMLKNITALPAYINEQYIYSNSKTESGVKICKYDYRNFDKVAFFDYQLSSNVKCVDTKMIFSEKKIFPRKIYCIDKDSGKEYWVFDVSELGEYISDGKEAKGKIESGLMIKEESLLVATSGFKLLKIDVSTGNLQWQREPINNRLQLYDDKLINVTVVDYREISTEGGENLVEYEMKSEYGKHGFNITGPLHSFTITDTHIFIVDAGSCRVGCINRSTGKIDWSVVVGEGKFALTHRPTIYRDRLYVLDDEGTLHIYEME